MRYCSKCAAELVREIPAGDNRERAVCRACGEIHYQNPNNVVGCLLTHDEKVLLCKRAIEPRKGYWTLPAGFMEMGETSRDGAAREAFEEACAQTGELKLFAIYNLPRISQVYLMYRGILKDGVCSAGEESLEVGLFSEAEIPWDNLAFPIVTEALTRFFKDPGYDGVYQADIFGRPGFVPEVVRWD